jgi:hypothetical protein
MDRLAKQLGMLAMRWPRIALVLTFTMFFAGASQFALAGEGGGGDGWEETYEDELDDEGGGEYGEELPPCKPLCIAWKGQTFRKGPGGVTECNYYTCNIYREILPPFRKHLQCVYWCSNILDEDPGS